MSSTKLAFLAVVVLASWCAVAGNTPAVMGFLGDLYPVLHACDGKFRHEPGAGEMLAALSTTWYDPAMCGKYIHITAPNGKEAWAKVVDPCDTAHGCKDNMIIATMAVWQRLELNDGVGEVVVGLSWA